MKADQILDDRGIEYDEVVQENPAKSCDDAARERGLETRQIVKSLIIKSEGEKFHVLLPGDRTLSEKKFGAEYRMMPPEESKKITGFESGTVHPFSTELHHVVDERVFENEKVSHTVGEVKRGLIIDAREFRRALEESDFTFETRDIVVSTDEDISELEQKGITSEDASFVLGNGYRNIFLDLSDEYDEERIVDLLRAFNRQRLEVEPGTAEEVLERAENQTHMQRIIEHLAERGELPDRESFDIGNVVTQIIEDNPEAVEDFRNGKGSAINYLMGQVMQETNGKADAGKVQKKIREELG